jgi:hypothetical protein
MKLKYLLTLAILLCNLILLKAQKTEAAARDVYNWKAYDSSASKVKKEAIDFRMIMGKWFAYEGRYYADNERIWKDQNQPRVLEIIGNKYRSGLYGSFKTYTMKANLLIFESENKVDSAYINLITDSKMIMSFKRGKDYERYIFEK